MHKTGEQPKQPNKVGTVFCPSEYEYVPGYYKKNGEYIRGFCRKKPGKRDIRGEVKNIFKQAGYLD